MNSAQLKAANAHGIWTCCCAQFRWRLPKVASLGSPWGAFRRRPERAYTCYEMSDPAPKPDSIDAAIAQFWKPQTLDELMAGKKPFTSWDDLDIPDLTDDERAAFAAALADE